MSVLPIRLLGDPVLRTRAKPLAAWDASLDELAASMVETMKAAKGVGLAAPQIGRSIELLVAQLPDDMEPMEPLVLANPEVIEEEGSDTATEGCLSIPEVEEDVERATRVRVRAMEPGGDAVEIEAEGYLARILLHEIDHLKGILFIDRISPLKRRALRNKLDEIRKRGEEMRGANS